MTAALDASAQHGDARALGFLDGVAATLYVGLVAFEAVADAQMFAFQKEKYRRRAAGEPAGEHARGFIEVRFFLLSRWE